MIRRISKITLLLAILLLVHFYIQNNDEEVEKNVEKNTAEHAKENQQVETIKFEKSPAYEEANYFEEVVIIDEQPMYYTYPLEIENSQPPTLVIYSHGQLQRITENLENEYMLKMQEYGDFFTSKGYAFSASNQHGDNWGGEESLGDIKKSILWFENNGYPISEKKHLLGFSMGGKTTINYAIKNPEDIATIALLAPTPKETIQKIDVERISEIPIKIWHGKEDVNIPFTASQWYVDKFESYGKQVTLTPISNATHYDIETTLKENILGFFEEHYLPH